MITFIYTDATRRELLEVAFSDRSTAIEVGDNAGVRKAAHDMSVAQALPARTYYVADTMDGTALVDEVARLVATLRAK